MHLGIIEQNYFRTGESLLFPKNRTSAPRAAEMASHQEITVAVSTAIARGVSFFVTDSQNAKP
jgi:hypothetical protein